MLDNGNVNHYIGYRETKVSFINLLNHFPGHTQCHTSLLATSSLGDGPWFYQVDTLVPTMDLSADRTNI